MRMNENVSHNHQQPERVFERQVLRCLVSGLQENRDSDEFKKVGDFLSACRENEDW